MCKMNLSRLREANCRQTQILRSLCFGCFVFKEVSHEWQSLANGRGGGCRHFHSFSWPLMLFTRGCLPLGQQYPPLNRKQDPCFRFLISSELVDVWPLLALNVRGLWGRDCFARYDPSLFSLIRCLWTIRKGIGNSGGNFFIWLRCFACK